jgi:2-polyprenyl-3-methyl-5-hydroxy-6-metoxy-1,4-benzoquinol methylase
MLKSIFGRSSAADPAARVHKAPHGAALRDMFAGASEAEWLWALTDGRENEPKIRELLPTLPPDTIQAQFTGRSNKVAFEQAIGAKAVFLAQAKALGLDLTRSDLRVLDFGCGWGRITQTLFQDFLPSQVTGCDVMPEALETCRQTRLPCELVHIPFLPPSPLPESAYDLVVAYSVFSHLSESAHMAWVQDLARALRPGGVLVVTTRPRAFIQVAEAFRKGPQPVPAHARSTALSFVDAPAWEQRYDRGEFCFDAASHGTLWPNNYYGEALVPGGFAQRAWKPHFDEVRFVSAAEHGRFDQSVIAARKPR